MLINVDFYIMALRDGFPVPDPAKLINSQGKHLPVQNRVLSRLKKEGADMFVYVIDKAERPLMPTSRCGHVRILLKQKKAKVVNRNPFTIQLLYDTPSITQNLTLGIDPGRTNIGLCIVTDDNR